jgi:hypothetical protein
LESQKRTNHSKDLDTRWENNIKMDVKETGWKGMDLIHVVQDRDRWWVMNMVMNFFPHKAGNTTS